MTKNNFVRFLLKRELSASKVRLPNRIDPPTCGCTDCLTGYSRPRDSIVVLDNLVAVVGGLATGKIGDATGMDAEMWDAFLDSVGFYN